MINSSCRGLATENSVCFTATRREDPLRGARLTRLIEKQQQDQLEEEYFSIKVWLCISLIALLFFLRASHQQHRCDTALFSHQHVESAARRAGIHDLKPDAGA